MKTILVDAIDGLIFKDGTIFQEMLDMLETFPNHKIVLTGANDEEFKKFKLDQVPYEVLASSTILKKLIQPTSGKCSNTTN